MNRMSSSLIHPSADVDPCAQLHKSVSIGPYSIIGPNVKLGADTHVASHVVIEGHTTIGLSNRVFQFASIGSDPQDLKYKGESSELIIGNNNIIREYVTLQPGTAGGKMKTIVGNDNLFMAHSHVAHDCIIGDSNVFANSATLGGHVIIGNKTILGGLSAVHQFCSVGDLVFISGGSTLKNNAPPFTYLQGQWAKIKGVNLIGMKRAGYSKEELLAIKKIYNHLFMSSEPLRSALQTVDQELERKPVVRKLLDFIERSNERGIAPHMV